MHKWIEIDRFHMQYGITEWRISFAANVSKPFCLHFGSSTIACFKTVREAKEHHIKVMSDYD